MGAIVLFFIVWLIYYLCKNTKLKKGTKKSNSSNVILWQAGIKVEETACRIKIKLVKKPLSKFKSQESLIVDQARVPRVENQAKGKESTIILLTIDEEAFTESLVQEINRGNLAILSIVHDLLHKSLACSLEKELGNTLLKPIKVKSCSGKYGVFALKDLAVTGYDTWSFELKFVTKHENSLHNIQIQSKGFNIEETPYDTPPNAYLYNTYKVKILKTQTNHYICLYHVILPPQLFQKAYILLIKDNTMRQPYMVDLYFMGGGSVNCPVIAFKHVLTGEYLFCECSKIVHQKLPKLLKDMSTKIGAIDHPDSKINKLIAILEAAKYKSELCHLCIQKKYGLLEAQTRYGDSIDSYIHLYNLYVGQIVLATGKDIRAVSEDIQIRLGVKFEVKCRWVQETELYKLAKKLFKNFEVMREASPSWLGRQRLDIYVPELNLAIEYQGEQHFKGVGRFGGEEGFIRTVERDKRKLKLCQENGVRLVAIKYDEPLTVEHLRKKCLI